MLRNTDIDSILTLVGVTLSSRFRWFSLNKSEMAKAVTLFFAAFIKVLLETVGSNLVSLTYPSFQLLAKMQREVFPIFGYLVNFFKPRTVKTTESVMILI